MIQSSIGSLACLLFCVVMSEGKLSPPQNLTVEFLDFRGEVIWCPGPGNPPSTAYTVELQPIGEEWNQTKNCVDIESRNCTLIFNLTINDLMTSYYLRVKASWRGESSDWTSLDTVQPYGNTLLSAPTLNVSAHGRDFNVHIHMPPDVLSVLPKLMYDIRVSESNSANLEEKNTGIIFSTDTGPESNNTKVSQTCCFRMKKYCKMAGDSLVCKNLNLGHQYCVRAFAIHAQQQNKPHHWSEKCVDLPSDTSEMLMHIAMATVLLGVIFLTLTIIICYQKPGESDLHMPKSLSVVGGADRAVMATPTEALTLLAFLRVTPFSSGTAVILLGDQSSCDWCYECRDGISCPDQTSDVSSWPADQEQLEGQPFLSPCPYSEAWDEGEDEKAWTTRPHLEEPQKEGGWQLYQASSGQDVPISSLSLNSGDEVDYEPGENCGQGGSDSVREEEAELDLEAELLGQSQRDFSGYLPSALENLDELFPFDPSALYFSGYEPRSDSTSYTTHSPLPACEQSVAYLKR